MFAHKVIKYFLISDPPEKVDSFVREYKDKGYKVSVTRKAEIIKVEAKK